MDPLSTTKAPAPGAAPNDAPPEDAPEYVARGELDAKLNAAITAHTKRLEKAFGEQLARLTAQLGQRPGDDAGAARGTPATGGDPPVDPKYKLVLEKLEQQEKRAAEAEARARATELAAQHDKARGRLRDLLDAKGIKGVRATAVLALLESSRSLRFDDDGKPSLAVRRSRAAKAPAEELAFDDLAAGVEDWAKTDDAREFLPPPAAPAGAVRRGAAPGATGRGAPSYERPAETADEAAARTVALLAAKGVDINAAFRRG